MRPSLKTGKEGTVYLLCQARIEGKDAGCSGPQSVL